MPSGEDMMNGVIWIARLVVLIPSYGFARLLLLGGFADIKL